MTCTTRIKVCCISSVEEAALAVRYGASALGLVSEMPSGPGVISDELIEEIAQVVPPGVASFLLTSKQDSRTIIGQQRRFKTNTLQLVDEVDKGVYKELRKALPGVGLVQVIHVTGEGSVAEASAVAPFVDAILLDSGNPLLKVKELGGTGRTHDWAFSRRIVEVVGVPVYLAGGLRPDNVADAIRAVRPFGVDLCSGIRTNGRLDEEKLAAFVASVRSADNAE